jgi:hypothetical protein
MRLVLMLIGFGMICLIVQATFAGFAAIAGVRDDTYRRASVGTYMVTATVLGNALRSVVAPESVALLAVLVTVLLVLWSILGVAAFSLSGTRAVLIAIPMSTGTLLLLLGLLRILPE